MTTVLQKVGSAVLLRIAALGRMGIFLLTVLAAVFLPPYKPRRVGEELALIGARSVFVVIIVGLFTGGVLSLQGYRSLRAYGAVGYLGGTVSVSLVRGAGPVLTGFLLAARAGSAIAARLGTMRITEQLDALEVMAVSPIHYLAAPNLLAGLVAFPLLTGVFDLAGYAGGYMAAVWVLNVDRGPFVADLNSSVEVSDLWQGLVKSVVFAVLVIWICTYKGMMAERGALGVSRATNEAVVTSVVVLIVFDYLLTAMGVFR
jgi:phospholipid/cholesterol/gamma-HCH transport system permease protein